MKYQAFDRDGQPTTCFKCATNTLVIVASDHLPANGWIEDESGEVVVGRKPIGTIDIKPTWRGMVPLLIAGLTEGTDAGRKIAREELLRMADAADAYNASIKP